VRTFIGEKPGNQTFLSFSTRGEPLRFPIPLNEHLTNVYEARNHILNLFMPHNVLHTIENLKSFDGVMAETKTKAKHK
jgi:hypothetical protein